MNPIQQAIEQATAAQDWLPTVYGELSGLDVSDDDANMKAALSCLERIECHVEAVLTSLRSLQKEVEGVELPPLLPSDHPEPHALVWSKVEIEAIQAYARTAVAAALGRGAPGSAAWENSEGWESLAWELCADENGEESCNELIWEGGPIPEPWGERWLKYEDEAKRLIALVQKHVRPAAPSPEATQPTQAEAPSEREAFCSWFKLKYLRSPHSDEGQPDLGLWQAWQARAALATQQAVQGEPVASESALASLIDLICPGLDSGDILADAQEAMRALNERTSQPESKARAVQRFHRDTFNAAAWVTQLTKAVEARGVTWAQVSEETGVSTTTLSRVRSGERQPDAASLAALSAWAGLNPANYCATPPAPGQVERDREDERGVANVANFDEFTEASDHCLLASEQDLRRQAKALHEFALPALRWAEAQMTKQRDDVSLLDWLDAKNKPFKMGWQVGSAPAGNVVVKSVIYPTTEPVSIRAAIRAARSSEGGDA